MHLLAQLIETLANAFFRSVGIRVNPPAEPVSSPLRPVRQIGLVHASQRVTQLRGGPRLARSQLTCRIPQVLLQLGEIVGELLPVLCQFVALLQPGFVLLLV